MPHTTVMSGILSMNNKYRDITLIGKPSTGNTPASYQFIAKSGRATNHDKNQINWRMITKRIRNISRIKTPGTQNLCKFI